jgi:hypothetical protein
LNSIGTRLDAVHKARQVGKRINLSAEKLDAFTLVTPHSKRPSSYFVCGIHTSLKLGDLLWQLKST